jgi:hypothetical protein
MRRLWLCSIRKRGANRHNDEIRMTKHEGMKNDHHSRFVPFGHFSFVLRHFYAASGGAH